MALSHQLASHGALLSIADLNEAPLRALAAELHKRYYSSPPSPTISAAEPPPPTPVLATVVDVTSPTSVNAWNHHHHFPFPAIPLRRRQHGRGRRR